MPTDPVEPVQPAPGQGEPASGTPYDEYLSRIPEAVRSDVEPVFRDWDANTTRKFQEAATYRDSWKPFEDLGVQKRDPNEVQWAMQFVDALQNPKAIADWYATYAQENGITQQQQQEPEYVDPAVTQMLEQQLSTQLGPVARQLQELSEWRTAQETQAREAQAMSEIKSQMSELKARHPDEFNEQMVEKLIPNYIESDPKNAVSRAFADWQAIRSQVERDTLQGKVNTPPGAESGGSAAGGPEPAKTLAEAAAQAMEQLRAARSA